MKEQFVEFQEKYKFKQLPGSGASSVVFNSVQTLGPRKSGLYTVCDEGYRYYLKFLTPSGMSVKAPNALKTLENKYMDLSLLLIDPNDPSEGVEFKVLGALMVQFLKDFRTYLKAIEWDIINIIGQVHLICNDEQYTDETIESWCRKKITDHSPIRGIEIIETRHGNTYKTGLTVEVSGSNIKISSAGVVGNDLDCINLTSDRWDGFDMVENYKDSGIEVTGDNNDEVAEFIVEYLEGIGYFLDEDDDNIDGQSHQLHEVMNEISDIFGEDREYYTVYR